MLIAQRPTLTEESLNPQRSRFTIEPLEPGFGYTLGNSLRRTLLSSIPGAAVTSVRISGVPHEFTTLPGVEEDVTEILLNIKGIVLTSEYDEPVVMYLRKSGKGEATAVISLRQPASLSPTRICISQLSLKMANSRSSSPSSVAAVMCQPDEQAG